MKNNILVELFKSFETQKIKYCVRGRYAHLPNDLDGGDVDILIDKKDFKLARKLIKNLGFKYYPHTQPNLFYFAYDDNLGLVQLDILIKQIIPIKKYKNFYIPKNNNKIPNEKTFLKKIFTGLIRRISWAFRGPIIVFEGPDGSGKTTLSEFVFDSFKKFPLEKKLIHFSTHFKDKKPSSLKRFLTRNFSILKTYQNKIFGKMTITDRYIYLTFRNHNKFLKNLLRTFAPSPNIVFIMKTTPEVIKKRKLGQRDLLSPKMIKELYSVYSEIKVSKKIEIDTSKSLKQNKKIVADEILKTLLK